MSSTGSQGAFGLPGANAMGDTLEFVKNLWGSMKIPGMTVPSLSPEDIDKQIADLKAVESWLQVNMNMLRSSIQALEVQSATLTALRSMGESFSQAAASASAPMDDKPAFESPVAKEGKAEPDTSIGAIPDATAMTSQFANAALWWNAVQEQFSNAVSQAMTPSAEPEPAKKPRKAPAKKTASAKTNAPKSAPRKRAAKP